MLLTGIEGLDTILDGKGIPRGYVVFVLGSPGSGKTTLALQFLYNGAEKYGENGVYVSLDEDSDVVQKNAAAIGLDVRSFVQQGKIAMVDASPIRFLLGEMKLGEMSLGTRDFTLMSLKNAITKKVEKIGAKRLVIDPLTALVLQYPNEVERRTAVLDLTRTIASTGCTALLVSELATSSLNRRYQFEEYLAQGVIVLRKLLRPGGVLRIFTVEKMRGVDHDPQPHPYKIGRGGVVVYPTEVAL